MRVTKANCYDILEMLDENDAKGYYLGSGRHFDYMPWSSQNTYYYATYGDKRSKDCKGEEQSVIWVIKMIRERFKITSKDLDKMESGDYAGLLE